MWTGTLRLGQTPLALLAAQIPAFLRRLNQIEFSVTGQAIIDGNVREGLVLLGGPHMERGATYAVVFENEGGQRLYILHLEEVSTECLVAIVASTQSGERVDQRWEIAQPEDPAHIRMSFVHGKTEVKYLIDASIDVAELTSAHPSDDPISVTMTGRKRRCWLAMTEDPNTVELTYRAGFDEEHDATASDGFARRLRSGAEQVTMRSWLNVAAAGYRRVSRTVDGDPLEILWHLTLGESAAKLDRGMCREIQASTPLAMSSSPR